MLWRKEIKDGHASKSSPVSPVLSWEVSVPIITHRLHIPDSSGGHCEIARWYFINGFRKKKKNIYGAAGQRRDNYEKNIRLQ